MHSDVPAVGSLESSSPLIGKLLHAANHSYLSNRWATPPIALSARRTVGLVTVILPLRQHFITLMELPFTKNGWPTIVTNSSPTGAADIIPTGGWGYGTDNGLDWTSTIAIIPWNIYLFYGDSKPLSDCYESIKRYVDYVGVSLTIISLRGGARRLGASEVKIQ